MDATARCLDPIWSDTDCNFTNRITLMDATARCLDPIWSDTDNKNNTLPRSSHTAHPLDVSALSFMPISVFMRLKQIATRFDSGNRRSGAQSTLEPATCRCTSVTLNPLSLSVSKHWYFKLLTGCFLEHVPNHIGSNTYGVQRHTARIQPNECNRRLPASGCFLKKMKKIEVF